MVSSSCWAVKNGRDLGCEEWEEVTDQVRDKCFFEEATQPQKKADFHSHLQQNVRNFFNEVRNGGLKGYSFFDHDEIFTSEIHTKTIQFYFEASSLSYLKRRPPHAHCSVSYQPSGTDFILS